MNLNDLKIAAAKVLAKTSDIASALRSKERADIESAASEHASMPKNYWESRWHAEQLQAAARGVLDALHEDEGEGK